MSENISASIVIPAYNEQHRISATLDYLLNYIRQGNLRAEVIVVDDGSIDDTCKVVESHAASSLFLRLLRMRAHRGKGAATREGFLSAQGEIVYLCDADLSSGFAECTKLEKVLLAGGDVAIGSRPWVRSLGHNRPWHRDAGRRVFNLSARCLLGLNFHDTQCGLKAFKREAAKQLCTHQRIKGWGFDLELLLLARDLGYEVVEVPLDFYHDYSTSKFHLIGDGFASFTDLGRILWYDLCGFYPRSNQTSNSVSGQLSVRNFLHQLSRAELPSSWKLAVEESSPHSSIVNDQ
ncbi:MAG: glycosyltransferase [Acidobacteria bacterium]|nr:glycosyltransferase [Acidobacteriota bacterium]